MQFFQKKTSCYILFTDINQAVKFVETLNVILKHQQHKAFGKSIVVH